MRRGNGSWMDQAFRDVRQLTSAARRLQCEAIQWADPGGEYYFSATSGAAGVWSAVVQATLVNNAPTGRTTTYAIQMTQSSSSAVSKVLGASFGTLCMGGAFYVNAAVGIIANTMLAFSDSGSAQCDVRTDSVGHLQITRNGTVLGTSTNILTPGQGWIFIEFQATFATGATGSAQVWVNGASWLSVSSVQTATTTTTANNCRWGGSVASGVAGYWKDMYVLDTGTGTNTARLGDITVGVIWPNAAGANQQWTLGAGASQTVAVQDGIAHTGTWPDSDTSYIVDSVSGHISDFAHQTLSAANLYAVVHVSFMRSDAGASNVQQWSASNGVNTATGNIALGGTYNYYYDFQDVDNSGAAWTVAHFNSATFGAKIP